jgi:hypothetical protein
VAGKPRTGPAELAARRDLRALPKLYGTSAVAKGYLELARILDLGVPARDAAAVQREMRLTLMTLYDLAPAKPEDDFVDEVRLKREERMKGIAAQ